MGQVTFGKQNESGKIAKNYSEIVAIKSQMKVLEDRLEKYFNDASKDISNTDTVIEIENLIEEAKTKQKEQTNLILAAVSVATAVICLLEVLL